MEKKEEEEDTEEEKKWVDAIKELRSQDKYMGCKRIYNALCQRDDFPFNKWSLKNFLYKKNLMIYATKPRSKLDTISKVKRRDKICFSWIDTGECRYGDLCKFFHGKKKNTKKTTKKKELENNANDANDVSKKKMKKKMKKETKKKKETKEKKETKKEKKKKKKEKQKEKEKADALALVEGVNKVVDAVITDAQKKEREEEEHYAKLVQKQEENKMKRTDRKKKLKESLTKEAAKVLKKKKKKKDLAFINNEKGKKVSFNN